MSTGRILLLAALLAMLARGAIADAPQRIVSLNLCTDQMLLALLPAERIVMLSPLARDPLLSTVTTQASTIAVFDGSVERVLKLDPDLVLAGTMASVSSAGVLRRVGIRVETLDMPESIAASLEFIERVGELVGASQQAQALRQQTEQQLAVVRERAAHTEPASLLVYLPNGLTPGTGTLKHELIELAGWRNLAAQRGIAGYGTLSLEELVLRPPALVLFDSVDLEHASMSQQLLQHGAIRSHIPSRPIPTRNWICGGPQIAQAAQALLDLHQVTD